LAVLLIAGCTSTPPTITPEPGTGFMTPVPAGEGVTVEILNSELAVGQERIAFRLKDPAGQPIGSESSVNTEFYRLVEISGEAILASSGPAAYFGGGSADGGSWVVYVPFDASGQWGMGLTATKPDGTPLKANLNVQVAAHPKAPRVGQMPPFTENPTAADGMESSDPNPEPKLYAMTIAEAMASGRPTVLHFSSPGHCATETCAYALHEIKTAMGDYEGRVNFIHVETRDAADSSALSETASRWGLPSEPWTFILDSSGRITTRVEGMLDRTELSLLLDKEIAATP
jgi:hypothetical protein